MEHARTAALPSRILILLLLATLVAGLAGEPLVEAKSKKRKPSRHRFTTITRTFTNSAEIVAPALTGPASPYPSSIAVGGFARARVTDVDVRLIGLSHGFPADLDVLLVAPDGRNALVLSDVASDIAVDNLTLTLDDEGERRGPFEALRATPFPPIDYQDEFPDAFPAPAPPLLGNVALATFDGIDPNGVWSLFVFDDVSDYDGRLAGGWSLTIEAVVPKDRPKKGRNPGKGRHGKRSR
jgi:hypothetical protein